MKDGDLRIQLMEKLSKKIELMQSYIEFELVYKCETNIIINITFGNAFDCWNINKWYSLYKRQKTHKKRQRKDKENKRTTMIAYGLKRYRCVGCCNFCVGCFTFCLRFG